jgi:sugar/nucleoside kinase (ribokinase family)
MDILVVGSVAFDSVETPFGKVDEVLGGSATYFSTSASYFAKVGIVAVVGEDFPQEHVDTLNSKDIDTRGLKKVEGKTFRWKGRYEYDLNQAHTLDTQLNVFSSFDPVLPEDYKDAEIVFLANIDPELQMKVLDQVKNPRIVACDTMNFWIEGKKEALKELFKRVEILIINEGEAREFADEPNLVKAAAMILACGPKTLIVKRGEYGALMFGGDSVFSAPAYPLEDIFDPTGAGDSFAGGFIGHLAASGNSSDADIRKAIIYGSVMASFNVEAFSLERLNGLDRAEIDARYSEFKRLTHFEDL